MESFEIPFSDRLTSLTIYSSRPLKGLMSDRRKGLKKDVDVAIGIRTMWNWPRSEGSEKYVGPKDRYTGGQI